MPETAALLLHILDTVGTVAIPTQKAAYERPDWEQFSGNPFARLSAWPMTWGVDFCGEFVAAKSPSFV